MPNPDLTEQEDMVRVNVKFGPHARHDYIKYPPSMVDWVKTTVVRYNDDPEWYISSECAPIDDKEDFDKDAEDIDVVLIFALPPRYWKLDDNKKETNVAFWASNLGEELGLENLDLELDDYFPKTLSSVIPRQP
jgi:hypothetical protein